MNSNKLLFLVAGLILVSLLLAACGGGTHPAISVVKQYIELGRELNLKEDAGGRVDVAPIVREARDLWDSFILDENELLVPLLSQYYETITYEVVEKKWNKV
jgi:hypothetical protein